MNIGSNEIEALPTILTLAHLWAAIRRLLIAKMGAEAARPHLIKLAHLIFLLSIYFGRRPERIRIGRIFRVNVRDIARRTGVPTSPPLVIEMSSALDMLRKHAIVFGCDEPRKPIARSRPFRNVLEGWLRSHPAYLRTRDPGGDDQLWT